MEFSEDIKTLLETRYPEKDIYNMTLEELKNFREEIANLREEYTLIELAYKLTSNALYGASANRNFYMYNLALAGDITGECRALTKWMWDRMEVFFHEDIWQRKDLWEKFDFALDENMHDWYRKQVISSYSDTDSCFKDSLINFEHNGKTYSQTIEELFERTKMLYPVEYAKSGHELINCPVNVLNWMEDKGLHYAKANKIVRHKVTKSRFKIKTKSGKEIIVTGDHSCVVFRDGKQLTIKAKDINPKTDKILSVKR